MSPKHPEDSIPIPMASEPHGTPAEQYVMHEGIRLLARHVQRRMRNMYIPRGDEQSIRLRRAVDSINLEELREMVAADLACDPQKWGDSARGTMALLDRYLGIHPRISREKLRGVDLQSRTLVQDVLKSAEGAIQDIGFFITEKGDDGHERQVGFDELNLRALQRSL